MTSAAEKRHALFTREERKELRTGEKKGIKKGKKKIE